MSITTVTFNSDSEVSALKRELRKGTKFLGSGAFASTYLKSGRKPVVIKIGRMGDVYIEYAKKVILAQSTNPFLPKIHSLTLYKAKRGDDYDELECHEFYAVRMERLYDLRDKHENAVGRIVNMMEQLVKYNYSVKRWMKNGDYNSFCIPGVLEIKVNVNQKAMLLLKDLRKLVMKALRVSGHGDWDIHGGNIMVRKNGELVLTDPIA